MAYREITVIEIKEVLRLWLQNKMGMRPIAEAVGVDRKTVRRYIDAGLAAGLVRDGGEVQLTDVLIGAVIEAVRPERPAGHGAAWEACWSEHDRIKAWLEYAQARGFVIDPARVRSPQDKPRVERTVTYVRVSFFAGEEFADLADIQSRAEAWRRIKAGMRIDDTVRARPAEVFAVEEVDELLAAPTERYDTPRWTVAKMHRDHHIEVAKALYSIPDALVGETVTVRVDSRLVKVLHRGQVVRIHPKQPSGRRSTDETDLPSEVADYAMRDLDKLQRTAARHGPAIGTYATELLDIPLPWTKMHQVYRLLGLVDKFGADPVNQVCMRALECEALDVGLIARIVGHAAESDPPAPVCRVVATTSRFVRDPDEFAVVREVGR